MGDAMHVILAATEVVETTTDSINWWTLIIGFAGGLALFLYGMDRMTESLRIVVGEIYLQ